MEYKQTLLMPKTDFQMRGNLANREPEQQKVWIENKVYEKRLEVNKENERFVLHDGPPYANGNIHIGHAFNKVLKDFVVRYKSMQGFYSPYKPGWDTHGLPIETALTKKGVNRKEFTITEFRKMCEKYAYEQVDIQKEQFKKLSILGDWDNPYITLTKDYEARQIELFAKMVEGGLIFKGLKPVYWSPSSESALAEAEIEYHDKVSHSIFVAFNVVDGKDVLQADDKLVIWTTTPWTLPANLAIAVNRAYEYSRVKVGDKHYVVAKELVESMMETFGFEDYQEVATLKGQDLELVTYKHAFIDRVSPVILGEHVTLDAGSGLVHTAPGHGEDDFHVGRQYGLEVLCPVNGSGILTEEAGMFAGQYYEKANKAIIEHLQETEVLLFTEPITHSYPHDWRTKKPVIFRATNQWFASIDSIRTDILKEIREVNWYPAWGEERLYKMIENRGDWCISRQRAWGVPIPIFYAEDETPILDPEVINHVASLFEEHGSNVWFDSEAKDLLPEGYTHPNSPNGKFSKETDIMDVWFDSGTSHTSAMHQMDDVSYPWDVYLEGTDQYRGWFNSSIITGVACFKKSPYKTVLGHGFVLDKNGRKMSKSLGNVIDPAKLVKQYGTDMFRLWCLSVDYTQDVRIGPESMKQISESYRKIRNTFKFLLGNLADFDPKVNEVDFNDLTDLDKFMMIELDQLNKDVTSAYDNFEYQDVFKLITNYVSVNVSQFYLDLAKDILYIESADSKVRRSSQTVVYNILNTLVKFLTPVLPFTCEEAYANMPGDHLESVYLTNMPKAKDLKDDDLVSKFKLLMELRVDVLKALENARAEKLIGKSLEAEVFVKTSEEILTAAKALNVNLNQFFIVSEFNFVDDVEGEELAVSTIKVLKKDGVVCARCWNVFDKDNMATEELCHRCNDVVN